MKGQPRREGPVRARALAQKGGAAQGPESATAWLDGCHEAIALHPEWQQLQAHLQELTAAAVRAHFDGCAHVHPHAVEAARQVTGELVRQGGETDLFPGPAQPQLLHEPYMSASGAAGLLSQTLVDVAAKLDREAEAQGTLESPEFQAFHALVSSVYVGSLQKRAEFVEKLKPTDAKAQAHAQAPAQGDTGGSQHRVDGRTALAGTQAFGGSSGSIGVPRSRSDKPGVAPASHQACSGDIAQVLVAIAMGDGFERFSTTAGVNGGGGGGGGAQARGAVQSGGKGGAGTGYDSYRGGIRAGGGGSGSLDNAETSDAQRSLHNSTRSARPAAAALQYLCENATATEGLPSNGEGDHGTRSAATKARFPGLEWLAPHIVGRSIPMPLRRELWQRTLLRGEAGGPSPVEVERLISRYAGEKGIVDPTNTPIAGMVATGVRHRAAEAFPWLARGGASELDQRNQACREAERMLNQYFVFVGRHKARHVASSLVLAYVFGREDAASGGRKGGGGGAGARGKGFGGGGGGGMAPDGRGGGGKGAVLVAMLHSLSTRFAPGMEELRLGVRMRAYEEIRRRDAPLFAHLSALFPGYKYGIDEKEDSDVAKATIGDDMKNPRGLIEAWLEDAFVGYLREDALLFVWDHLFLLGWREQLPLFVADIAVHLRATLIKGTVPLTLLSLARDACRRICTRDVREAFRRRSEPVSHRTVEQEDIPRS